MLERLAGLEQEYEDVVASLSDPAVLGDHLRRRAIRRLIASRAGRRIILRQGRSGRTGEPDEKDRKCGCYAQSPNSPLVPVLATASP